MRQLKKTSNYHVKKIAIQDANILIDLVSTGLFDHCLALNYQFSTTDLILAELYEAQVELIQPHINSGKFEIITVSIEELLVIQQLSAEETKLSEQDWSAVYVAQKKKAILLSGDKRLRTLAEQKSIVVCGILWVLDELVRTGLISHEQACAFVSALMNRNKRLPLHECEKRKKKWCG
jgi:predicted nucleic acid-binding protein